MHAACINWVFSSGYSVFCQFNSQSLETEPIRVEGEGFPLQIKIVKDPFKVQVKTVNFNVTVQNKKIKKKKQNKITDVLSDSTMQRNCKKLSVVELWSTIKEE